MLLKGREGDRRFFMGFLAGLCAALFVLSFAGTSYILIRGLRFSVDEEELALAVKEKTILEAQQQAPELMAQLQEQLPAIVASMVPGTLSVSIGTTKFDLPPETVDMIKKQIGSLTSDTLKEKLNEVDVQPYATRLGDLAYDLVKSTLESEVRGRTFHLQANKWMSIPITVMTR